jgi:hypothetical protein
MGQKANFLDDCQPGFNKIIACGGVWLGWEIRAGIPAGTLAI